MGTGKSNPNPNGNAHTPAAAELIEKQQAEGMAERLSIIHECVEQIGDLVNQRKAIQANVQAVREKVEALGVSKKAFDMALAYSRMDEDQRGGFDLAYAIARRAIGLPIQADLFENELVKGGEEGGDNGGE